MAYSTYGYWSRDVTIAYQVPAFQTYPRGAWTPMSFTVRLAQWTIITAGNVQYAGAETTLVSQTANSAIGQTPISPLLGIKLASADVNNTSVLRESSLNATQGAFVPSFNAKGIYNGNSITASSQGIGFASVHYFRAYWWAAGGICGAPSGVTNYTYKYMLSPFVPGGLQLSAKVGGTLAESADLGYWWNHDYPAPNVGLPGPPSRTAF